MGVHGTDDNTTQEDVMRIWKGLIGALVAVGPAIAGVPATSAGSAPDAAVHPRIVNIINFIRGVEPRSDVDLLEPVRRQIRPVHQYKLPATFLVPKQANADGGFARSAAEGGGARILRPDPCPGRDHFPVLCTIHRHLAFLGFVGRG